MCCKGIAKDNEKEVEVNMSEVQQIDHLTRKLEFLGYDAFQVDAIIQDAAGGQLVDEFETTDQHFQAIYALEKYVQLGNEYVASYSK